MEHFGESARRLIVRALKLAQECGAELLMPDHLLVSVEGLEELQEFQMLARSSLERRGASPTPPAIGPDVLLMFEKAFQIACGPIEEFHLLLSLPLWGLGSKVLFHEETLGSLKSRGVDVQRLKQALDGRVLLEHLPGPEFWRSNAGKQIADLATGHPDPSAYTILLSLVLRGGPLSETLIDCGLTEPKLIALLSNFPESSVESLLASADLGPAGEGLTRAARVALIVGWNCAKRQILGGQNLLDGVLCADILCQPGQGATRILRKLKVLGFAHAATREMVEGYASDRRELAVSAQVFGALEAAREIAGTAPVGTEHLLYGLSKVGLEELRVLLVTPGWIQQNLGPAG